MNYNDHRPGLKARAAHLALALSSAAAVLTLGVSAVTAMPASAAGMASLRPRSVQPCQPPPAPSVAAFHVARTPKVGGAAPPMTVEAS